MVHFAVDGDDGSVFGGLVGVVGLAELEESPETVVGAEVLDSPDSVVGLYELEESPLTVVGAEVLDSTDSVVGLAVLDESPETVVGAEVLDSPDSVVGLYELDESPSTVDAGAGVVVVVVVGVGFVYDDPRVVVRTVVVVVDRTVVVSPCGVLDGVDSVVTVEDCVVVVCSKFSLGGVVLSLPVLLPDSVPLLPELHFVLFTAYG